MAGETPTLNESLARLQGNTFQNLAAAVSSFTTIKGSAGYLIGIGFNDSLAKTTIIYDAAVSAGGNTNTIATLDAPAKGYLAMPAKCVNGIAVSATSACNMTFFYL